jgi:TolB protein
MKVGIDGALSCKRILVGFFVLFIHFPASLKSQSNIGIFENSEDVGHPKSKGSASFDPANQVYDISGGGYNIWFNRDEFHFLYKKLKGDFILTADFEFTGDTVGTVGHRKIGWMIRQAIDEDAASFNSCIHIDGLVVLQWRPYKGMFMRDPEEECFYPKKGGQTIQLERIGKRITMRIAHPGEPLQFVGSVETDVLDSEVLAGVYILSHDSNTLAHAKIWNVRIDKPVFNPYTSNPHAIVKTSNDILGSRLEILDITDGRRKIIHEADARFEAPNWMSDGKNLLFNQAGHLYRIPLEGGTPQVVNTGSVNQTTLTSNKTGHVDGPEYSPDGRYIYYNANVSGTMQIWRMLPDGTGKQQLTFDEYHNWFPHISPDGKWMVFISFPYDIDPNAHPFYKQVMLRLMPITVPGAPKVVAYLFGGEGTLNAPCWSPDSRYIAFVSNSQPIK